MKILHDQSHVTSKINLTNTYIPPKIPQSKPTYDRSYFCSKILDQYPNLYREFSSENVDYYGIIDKTSCPLCKLDHDDEEGIEGKYEARSYFIKCEQREIEIETGNEPWQFSEVHGSEVINSMPENKVSSFSEQCEEEGSITFIIKSVLKHFPYLKFRNSFRGIDNYNFALPQPWNSPCPICNGKYGNYGLQGEWYRNGTEYCLTCFTSSNKIKFTIVA
ncbi:hypothetical protein GLOIN_2v1766999 [Rhizophagus irregularis DAOM 181602=DAOM 197198]|uniref:Uncharacterized protein n=1 Tax=Rhizophagus irregularis (strain DAOM 181602 / DAOM 197198 / MUCL 43194) TaxID=747089 RepID=A0A2P4QKT3_RHIID|nr:hypothetical protein GLOIN_2v1766999 [Rhizophagus irregularis DAOM 181602=DAOM 197198]POG78244.1 hypothetical protein GLOIN_2v1766999 [Rhizophagus irregularis DAOM 181602=DAOM 197198]GBC23631.2 hypothetical protein GLOIN_2v1766999 [Rhizophagus irregularis DAOM 181602=DAOM 197198]|eukprot:XP_025185110.1 hypothetical protein GLOIN_2v1766999 [Rhizophagus irregularis DAOM 181602=DAOM 197198]